MTNKLIVLLLMIFVADVRAAGPAKDFKIVSVNCTLKSGGPAPDNNVADLEVKWTGVENGKTLSGRMLVHCYQETSLSMLYDAVKKDPSKKVSCDYSNIFKCDPDARRPGPHFEGSYDAKTGMAVFTVLYDENGNSVDDKEVTMGLPTECKPPLVKPPGAAPNKSAN